jgi:hypothetical protein
MAAPEGFELTNRETLAEGGKGQVQTDTGGVSSGSSSSTRTNTENRGQATDIATTRRKPGGIEKKTTIADPTTRTQTQTVPQQQITTATTRQPVTTTNTVKGHAVVRVKCRLQIINPGPYATGAGLSC